MKQRRTWINKTTGQTVVREYDYPHQDWRKYRVSAADAALAALNKGPLIRDSSQHKYVAGAKDARAFNYITVHRLVEAGLAEKRGDEVVRVDSPSIQPEEE